ncbi:hypothetical protein RZS08_16025, partial [Arthrospira platensis SPKY1]|nr:hypothetical protein [Arthrospira platensis SPKY1]
MEVIDQTLEEILGSLCALTVDWEDDVARRVIARMRTLPVQDVYSVADVRDILDGGPFNDGLLIARLFLGLSKDQFTAAL